MKCILTISFLLHFVMFLILFVQFVLFLALDEKYKQASIEREMVRKKIREREKRLDDELNKQVILSQTNYVYFFFFF